MVERAADRSSPAMGERAMTSRQGVVAVVGLGHG